MDTDTLDKRLSTLNKINSLPPSINRKDQAMAIFRLFPTTDDPIFKQSPMLNQVAAKLLVHYATIIHEEKDEPATFVKLKEDIKKYINEIPKIYLESPLIIKIVTALLDKHDNLDGKLFVYQSKMLHAKITNARLEEQKRADAEKIENAIHKLGEEYVKEYDKKMETGQAIKRAQRRLDHEVGAFNQSMQIYNDQREVYKRYEAVLRSCPQANEGISALLFMKPTAPWAKYLQGGGSKKSKSRRRRR